MKTNSKRIKTRNTFLKIKATRGARAAYKFITAKGYSTTMLDVKLL